MWGSRRPIGSDPSHHPRGGKGHTQFEKKKGTPQVLNKNETPLFDTKYVFKNN